MIELSDYIESSAKTDIIYDEYAIYASISENYRLLFEDLQIHRMINSQINKCYKY